MNFNGTKSFYMKQREYWWKRSESLGWIFILSVPSLRQSLKGLSPNMSALPNSALFHRLDLLSPQEAKICRHFNQMATLGNLKLFYFFKTYLYSLNEDMAPNLYGASVVLNLVCGSHALGP